MVLSLERELRARKKKKMRITPGGLMTSMSKRKPSVLSRKPK
jgi:hypothetical protein